MGKAGPVVVPFENVTAEVKLVSGVRKSRNVVAYLPGDDLAKEHVIIGAHIDHLGRVASGAGKIDIYNGADDNASGVAGVLEIAKAFATDSFKPRRTMVFVIFGSEEIGVLGSAYYARNPSFPLDKTHLLINLDMIRRNNSNTITVSSLGSAETLLDETKAINENFGGIKIKAVYQNIAGGDHLNFYLKKVPVVFFCDMGHFDYHKPTDTADKINGRFGHLASRLAYQYAMNLSDIDEKLKYQAIKADAQKRPRGSRAKLGFMPDMAFSGKGIKVAEPSPGGSAEKAGIKANDVVVKVNEFKVTDIYSYMDACKKVLGQKKIKVVVKRDGKEQEFELILNK